MKPKFPQRVEAARIREGKAATNQGDQHGCFSLYRGSANLRVIVSTNPDWEHVSVSLEDRCPTWDEMCWIKSLFFEPEECCMQLHPPESDYVNCHPHCLHIWKPGKMYCGQIPRPPAELVGPKRKPGSCGVSIINGEKVVF